MPYAFILLAACRPPQAPDVQQYISSRNPVVVNGYRVTGYEKGNGTQITIQNPTGRGSLSAISLYDKDGNGQLRQEEGDTVAVNSTELIRERDEVLVFTETLLCADGEAQRRMIFPARARESLESWPDYEQERREGYAVVEQELRNHPGNMYRNVTYTRAGELGRRILERCASWFRQYDRDFSHIREGVEAALEQRRARSGV